MNFVFIKNVVVGFMVYEIPRVYVFGYFPLHTQTHIYIHYINN